MLLLPGEQSIPEGGNPYIFLGGLSQAADVLVRAAGADAVVNEVTADYSGVEVEVKRDGSTAGPVILIKVTASTDGDAEAALGDLVATTESILDDLQESEGIAPDNQIVVTPITIDSESTLEQRHRAIVSVGGGLAVAAGAIVLAGLIDGLTVQRRRRGTSGEDEPKAEDTDPIEPADGEDEDLLDDQLTSTVAEDSIGDDLQALMNAAADQDAVKAPVPRRRSR